MKTDTDNAAIEMLLQQVRYQNIITDGYFLARIEKTDELVLAQNSKIERLETDHGNVNRLWTTVIHAFGEFEQYVSAETISGEQIKHSSKLIVPVEDELYQLLYKAWAELPEDEKSKEERRALVRADRLAQGLLNLD